MEPSIAAADEVAVVNFSLSLGTVVVEKKPKRGEQKGSSRGRSVGSGSLEPYNIEEEGSAFPNWEGRTNV